MKLIQKGIRFFKKNGFWKTIIKSVKRIGIEIRKIPYLFLERFFSAKKTKELQEAVKEKTVYVMIAGIDWHVPLYQRPQQIASVLAEKEDSICLFVSDQYQYDHFSVSEKISQMLYLYSPRMTKRLDVILADAREVICFLYWPRQAHLLTNFHYDKLVYEHVDDLSLFYYHDAAGEEIHRKLLEAANLTVVTAEVLYEQAKPFARYLLLAENAGDYAFFKEGRSEEINPRIKETCTGYDAVLGYYGSLANWFDYDLINEIAAKKENWLFILIGYDFDGTLDALAELPNILHIEAQPYEKLPSYIVGFSLQLIPFHINEITEATSPVKLFEYMASGKPILTSDLPECRKYKSVYRYQNVDDFIKKAEYLLSLPEDDSYFALLEQEAQENTWQTRVDLILETLENEEA